MNQTAPDNTPKIFFATPLSEKPDMEYTLSGIALTQKLTMARITTRWSMTRASLITRARNVLVARMMGDEQIRWTHLFFIDGDVGYQPDAVARLIQHDHSIACGVYPRKSDPLREKEWPCRPLYGEVDEASGTGLIRIDNRTGCIELRKAPTGFMCIKREVLEKLFEAFPERRCRLGEEIASESERRCSYALFNTDIAREPDDEPELESEDYGFCRLWRQIGGTVWADPTIRFTHTGTHVWEGSLDEALRPQAETEKELITV